MPALGREEHFRLRLERNACRVPSLRYRRPHRARRRRLEPPGAPTRCGMLTKNQRQVSKPNGGSPRAAVSAARIGVCVCVCVLVEGPLSSIEVVVAHGWQYGERKRSG